MNSEKFLQCHAVTAKWEGGWSDHPADPGGKTMYGVTETRWHEYQAARGLARTPVRSITKDQALAFYVSEFWRPIRGEELPAGVDLAVYDGGVNSGVSRSVKWLQAVVGETQDGIAGPITLNATAKAAPAKTIKAHCAKRLGFVRSLAIWNTFGKGWSRRIANVEATALSWVLTKPELEREAKDAKDKATQQGGGAVVVGGGGGVASPELANSVPWWVLALVITVIVGILLVRTIINAQRAQALSAKAKEA
jgi:lysozyme family protein